MPPFLTTLASKLIAAGVAALILLAVGGYGGYRWELGTYEALKADDAYAAQKATATALVKQHTIDERNRTVAVAAALAQSQIVTQTVTITKEIPHYVHDTITCPGPTVGLARVLYAAAAGADPATLQLAAGQSDDTCSDVAPSEVAGWFTGYAGAARANTKQLSDLIASVRDNDKVATAP